jgi:integrase
LRVYSIDRRRMLGGSLVLPGGESHDPADTVAVLDRLGLPDGFPFVLDDDGRADGCHYLNQYLLDAWAQRAFDLDSMRRFHVYNLARFLRFLRRSQAHSEAGRSSPEGWMEVHGEPKLDLTDATRDSLISYRDARAPLVEASTLRTELGCITAFYSYATKTGWVNSDPVPRWGAAQRNMLLPRTHRPRVEKFLSESQTRHFLEYGLRGDGAGAAAPAFPERDYSYGLLLVTTGLRREEAAFLLDGEIPLPGDMPPSGVESFPRTGKKGFTRTVYITSELIKGIDLYRRIERPGLVKAAQPRLRRLRREGRLFVVDTVTTHRGRPVVLIDGHRIPMARLSNEQRAIAVRVQDGGTLDPLGLFLARGGLPPAVMYWNELFADARDRVDAIGAEERPPAHITVSPHTMRHTFAVRMLAALMREGRDRENDPYFLLVNPLLTVQQLLGHASLQTTQQYLFAAEQWHEELPAGLRRAAASLVNTRTGEQGASAAETSYE